MPLLRAQNIEALAISFLHSYINPAHEERARERLARALPGVSITGMRTGKPLPLAKR